MQQLVPCLASEQLPSISSFLALGRVRGPLGEATNGLEVVDKAAPEVQVMRQITGD